MKEQITSYNFEKISSKMTRSFGLIKKGHENGYEYLLLPMERNLLKVNRLHQINNGRYVIDAIHICLFIIDGYLKKTEYDLDKYTTSEVDVYVKALLSAFDPFTNNEILEIAKNNFDLNSADDLTEYFSIPIKCLVRLEKSIELWTKENGTNGYFIFIEDQFGPAVNKNSKMEFAILK